MIPNNSSYDPNIFYCARDHCGSFTAAIFVWSASEIFTRVLYLPFPSGLSDPFVRRVPIIFPLPVKDSKAFETSETTMMATGILGHVRVAICLPRLSHHAGCCRHRSTKSIASLAPKSGLTDPRRALPGIRSEYAIHRTIRLPADVSGIVEAILGVLSSAGRLPSTCESHLHDSRRASWR